MYKTVVIIFLLQIVSLPQVRYLGEIGRFNSASSFHISASGFILITDAGNDKVYKLDTLGNLLKETGGYGWQESSFDIPNDVFANPLNIYIADKNNHRIQRFDKDLNFISSLSTRNSDNSDLRFGFPLSCVVTNQGDLFILDSENKRIIKFDLFGEYVQDFGGYDWGNYALKNPLELGCDPNNNIYAADGNKIVIFDQFGNGIGTISVEDEIKGINIVFNHLTINTDKEIYHADLKHDEFGLNKIKPEEESFAGILSSFVFNNKLYLLTSKKILIYSF